MSTEAVSTTVLGARYRRGARRVGMSSLTTSGRPGSPGRFEALGL
jgi:hypothetical protein